MFKYIRWETIFTADPVQITFPRVQNPQTPQNQAELLRVRANACVAEEEGQEETILYRNKTCLFLPYIFSLNDTQMPSDQFSWNEPLILISLDHLFKPCKTAGDVFALSINTLIQISLASF